MHGVALTRAQSPHPDTFTHFMREQTLLEQFHDNTLGRFLLHKATYQAAARKLFKGAV